ncbi:gp53-like domain-containing protein [Citrobacter portucalensis]
MKLYNLASAGFFIAKNLGGKMALSLLAANNAQTVLAAGISSTATSLTVNTGTGTLFPSPVTGTSFFKLTIIDAATGSLTEIVHVTARNGDVFTIQRGQEGTVARAWSANDIAANMMTAGTLSYILGNFQPLDPTLTALAALVGVANKLPYFNGNDTAALTDLTQVGRDIIGKSTIADILTYLGLDTALAAKQPLSTQLTYFANHSDTEILQYLGVPSVISAAISSLVDSSPAALDTLNELAEALGNDPNFSTTVLNKLAGKQPLDATLTGLSGKNDAGLRAYLSLKSAAMRDVGSQLGQLPGMDLFSSTIAGTGEKALPDFNTGTGMFILKWGAIAAPTTSQDITTLFQTPFPNKCLRVFATADYEPGTGNAMYIAVNNSTLQRDRFVARFAGSANYTSGVYFGLGY